MSLIKSLPTREGQVKASIEFVDGLQDQLDTKQEKLTAGTNITIKDNVISASGGGGGTTDLSDYLKKTDISDWAKATNKPTYTASEVGALPSSTTIPTKTSQLTNDSNFLTEHQSLDGYATESFVTSQGFIKSYTETDPVFTASPAHDIKATDITNWNSKTSNEGTITKVTTKAGKHTAVDVSSGSVSFNVPTSTSHLTNDSGFITDAGVTSVNGSTGAVTITAEGLGALTEHQDVSGKLDKSGGTMTGALVAQTNINYTTRQVRNVIISTTPPTASDGQNGDIWIVYEE